MLKTTFGLAVKPYIGAYKQNQCAGFFPNVERKPVSVAIIPLIRRGKFLGSLNFGSFQTDRFLDNMATDFIEHMVSVVSICLENNLNFEMMLPGHGKPILENASEKVRSLIEKQAV